MVKKDNPFKNLLKPIKLGPVELKHRMVLAPMNGHDGEATEQTIAYYAARAKGGAAMVITGAIMGTKLASQFVWGRNLYCFNPGHVVGLKMLTDRIHYFGS
jgi:2,4-dienoyl-CoA reductase-like NADH-dependent reductase (Old Yellow Enzyme family)